MGHGRHQLGRAARILADHSSPGPEVRLLAGHCGPSRAVILGGLAVRVFVPLWALNLAGHGGSQLGPAQFWTSRLDLVVFLNEPRQHVAGLNLGVHSLLCR